MRRCASKAAFYQKSVRRSEVLVLGKGTHAIVLPSTVTLICHIARSPSPDMASDPICTGVVHECREILNGFPSGIPGTKQVSNGVGLVTAMAC
jgi:hypothetical protein